MKSNYKQLGRYISEVNIKNTNLEVDLLLGVSITKKFIPSIANTIGTDMSKYKIVRKNQFGYGPITSRNGDKISVALLTEEQCIISTSYRVFEINDHEELDPEYLMMWFRRSEFDRYARFMSHGSTREAFDWDEMCETELPIPSITKQREIIKEYNTIIDRISLNEELNHKLEETAQALYKQLFVDNKDIKETRLEEYIEFNPKHSVPKGNLTSYIEMADVQEDSLSIKNVIVREYTSGSKFMNRDTLFARITPCLENGKTAYVNCLLEDEVAYGSTEFIVLRAKIDISPFWVYCLSKEDHFRSYAISSMVGSSGRQRVHSNYLKEYKVTEITLEEMKRFDELAKPIFESIRIKSKESTKLLILRDLVLSKVSEEGNYE